MNGCGHSFHTECLIPEISSCPLCKQTIATFIEELSGKANDVVFNLDDEEQVDATTDEEQDGRDEEIEEGGEDSDEDEVDATDNPRFSAIVNSIWSWQRPIVDML